MGYRLHVAKVYKVEYALGDAFSYKVEEFHNLLSACDATYTGESYDSDFEVTKEDWKKVIDKDEVIHMLEYYLEHADPDSDYLHLSFF